MPTCKSCNPIQPSHISPGNGFDGACGTQVVYNVIGRFKTDSCIGDKLVELATNQPNLTSMQELYDLFIFDSTEVEFFSDAQVNQACTFLAHPALPVFGSGASHMRAIPIYCNMVQQLPQLRGKPNPNGFEWPNTLGQYNLQFNRFVNPQVVYYQPLPGSVPLTNPLDVINLLPVLARLTVRKDDPIYQGFI